MATLDKNPPHPGELIQRTYIDPFGSITANMIAQRLHVTRTTLNQILNGKSSVSPEMAVRLSAVLGGSAESWLALQQDFDLHNVRQYLDIAALSRIDFVGVT